MNEIEVRNGFLHLHSSGGADIYMRKNSIMEVKPSKAETVVYTSDGSLERVTETAVNIIDAIGSKND